MPNQGERHIIIPGQQHDRKVDMSQYTGVGSNSVELDPYVANKFMTVSDMRSNIYVVEGFSAGKKPMTARRDNGAYYIDLHQQALGSEIEKISYKGNVPPRVATTDTIGKYLKMGLQECLIDEKIFNQGKHDLTFFGGYFGFLLSELIAGSNTISTVKESINTNLDTGINTALTAAIAIVGINFMINGPEKLWSGNRNEQQTKPFVRTESYGWVAPTTPIDRWARGRYYLKSNANNLVQPKR